MARKLIELSGIEKSFGSNRVLDGVNFDLEEGEVHVLAGENGAGKSTLIKILGGIHTDFAGKVRVGGSDVRLEGPSHASALGISVIHQELSLVEAMSVADNICLGRESTRAAGWWLARGERTERVRELCARLQLEFSAEELERPVESFSLSVRNRIEIAKALAGNAKILVMDEPTSALNRAEVEKLFSLIEALKKRGCGIVYISHKMEEIYRLADRITVLRDGRWVGTACARDCPERTLIRWMIGRDLSEQIPAAGGRSSAGSETPRLELTSFTVPSPLAGRPDAVRGLSLTVGSGEILGIAGLQGAGNSELFNGLFGAYGPVCSGQVQIDGQPFFPHSPQRSIARGIAYLTGDRKGSGLVLGLSVASNVSLASLPRLSPGGFLRPVRERWAAERSVETLQIRLTSIGQEVGTLSGGNQQKVVLAKWLETSPRILLLEEPTRGVDIGAKHEIYALLRRLASEGVAILLMSTEMPELLGLSDRILVLHRGEAAGLFRRSEATPERILAAAMGAGEESPN